MTESSGDQNSTAQTMVLEYGFGNSFPTVASWTAPGSAFNFTSPVHSNSQEVDGNAAGRVANIGGNISSLNWTPGSTLWIRFVNNNDAGNDDGLAVDNFSFSTSANVPEPATLATAGLVLLLGTATRIRGVRVSPRLGIPRSIFRACSRSRMLS
jgi:hypothetical protein